MEFSDAWMCLPQQPKDSSILKNNNNSLKKKNNKIKK